MMKTILVPLDGSALSERALPYAEQLATVAGARLILLRVPEGLGNGVNAARTAEAYLELFTARLSDSGLACESVVTESYGNAPAAIVNAIRARRPDLVVMSTHGRSGLGRWLYGSVADHVLRHVETPVTLVHPGCAAAFQGGRANRLLVALDGTPLAEEAVVAAGGLAKALGAEILLFQAIEPAYPLNPEASSYSRVDDETAISDAYRYLETHAGRLRETGRAVTTRAVKGYAQAAIPATAREEGADLIVMATHGRTGPARIIMGSVATTVLHRSEVPLVLVRPIGVREFVAEPVAAGV